MNVRMGQERAVEIVDCRSQLAERLYLSWSRLVILSEKMCIILRSPASADGMYSYVTN